MHPNYDSWKTAHSEPHEEDGCEYCHTYHLKEGVPEPGCRHCVEDADEFQAVGAADQMKGAA
jgi:hypothetical protein